MRSNPLEHLVIAENSAKLLYEHLKSIEHALALALLQKDAVALEFFKDQMGSGIQDFIRSVKDSLNASHLAISTLISDAKWRSDSRAEGVIKLREPA